MRKSLGIVKIKKLSTIAEIYSLDKKIKYRKTTFSWLEENQHCSEAYSETQTSKMERLSC